MVRVEKLGMITQSNNTHCDICIPQTKGTKDASDTLTETDSAMRKCAASTLLDFDLSCGGKLLEDGHFGL